MQLQERCDLIEQRMANYDKQHLGYVLLKNRNKEKVLVKKRQRGYNASAESYFGELDSCVEVLQSKNIKPNNRNLRALGFGALIVNRYLKQGVSES